MLLETIASLKQSQLHILHKKLSLTVPTQR